MDQPYSEPRDPLFALAGVGFSHGSQDIFKGLDLHLHKGKCYGILGPNGSGKTTLLDLLCGLLQPSSGSIELYGKKLSRWQQRMFARRVALVPQEFAVRFDFSVRQVVEMGRHPHLARFDSLTEEEYRLIDAALDEMGITHLAERPVTRLSGGEKQRVAVARALVQNPDVLLLDEATSNLDIYHSLSILTRIKKRVLSEDLTVVAALHDLNLAGFFCDELVLLKDGQIHSQGATQAVLCPDIIQAVYGVDARVRQDSFSDCLQVSYRMNDS